MKNRQNAFVFQQIIPYVISLALIIGLISYAPWNNVARILKDFDLTTIALLLGLSLVYYGLKAVRFWYLLQALEIYKPLTLVTLSYLSAQPVSLLPAGEIYRSHALRKYTGVSVERSLPQFTMQGLLEGAAMGALMLISALALGRLRVPALIFCVVVLLVIIAIGRGYMNNATRLINHLPFIRINEQTIKLFNKRHKGVLSWRWLPFLFGLSILIEIAGSAIAYVSVVGIGGRLNVYQAILVYIIPVIVGFISFLPGGFGLSEQSAIGVLLLSNIKIATAVAATLIMRVTIVGLGVAYGIVAQIVGHTRNREEIAHIKSKRLSKTVD